MTSVLKWRAAFLEIYGRNPRKKDYIVAPNHVKEEYFGGCAPTTSTKVNKAPNKGKVCLKRPRIEDDSSPVKRPSKARRLYENSNLTGTGMNLEKGSFTPARPWDFSPVKFDRILNSSSKDNETIPEKVKSIPCSTKPLNLPADRISTEEIPTFNSLFDTPEKGQPAAWGEISPQKPTEYAQTSGGSPLRSPRKPYLHKAILVKNAECLLLPTPEKCERKEILEPFTTEEVPSKNLKVAKNDRGVAFCPEKGRIVKKALKRRTPNNGALSKKLEGNYVKINLRRKKFSRGKVSAEHKRKIRRRQKWKRIGSVGG